MRNVFLVSQQQLESMLAVLERDLGLALPAPEVKMVEVRRAVIDGATLSTALTAQQLFPDLFTDMMAVGEQTGHFSQTMQTIADVYERELDRTVKTISALIPPVIIVLIAIVVGFVVYSILSAVFEMTHSLQVRPT